MNLIPVIRETLGLKIEEEFELLKSDGTLYNNSKYRFADNDTLQWFDSYTGCWKLSRSTTLENIVYGKVTVKKLPFKPNEYEAYYFVNLYFCTVEVSASGKDFTADVIRVNSGNCYRTKEEAENHVDEWMTKVYGKDWRELLK